VLLVDIERGPIRLGRAREIARQLDADYRHLDDC
jgi:magnesium chelatase subunit ChlD-like protein